MSKIFEIIKISKEVSDMVDDHAKEVIKYKNYGRGYYWVKLHPIYEDDEWTVAFFDGTLFWYMHNVEGPCNESIYEISDYIEQKK